MKELAKVFEEMASELEGIDFEMEPERRTLNDTIESLPRSQGNKDKYTVVHQDYLDQAPPVPDYIVKQYEEHSYDDLVEENKPRKEEHVVLPNYLSTNFASSTILPRPNWGFE